MSDHETLAEVVSLAEFRDGIRGEQKSPEPVALEPLDQATYKVVSEAYRFINPHRHGKLVVVTKTRPGDSKLKVARTDDADYYALARSSDELEELMADTEFYDDEQAEKIRTTIDRIYTASLVIRHALSEDKRIKPDRAQAMPYPNFGSLDFNIESNKSLMNITSWRICSGVGLIALGGEQPKFRERLKHEYLQGLLVSRQRYLEGIAELSALFGKPPTGCDYQPSEQLIGFCNPLERMQISLLLTQPEQT